MIILCVVDWYCALFPIWLPFLIAVFASGCTVFLFSKLGLI